MFFIFLANAKKFHLRNFMFMQLHKHKRASPLIARTCNAPRIEHGHISAFFERRVRVSVDCNIRPCFTCRRGKHRCIKTHVKEMPVREKNAVASCLHDRLLIDAVRVNVTVAENALHTLACQFLQIIRIWGEIPRMQPKFHRSCAGYGKHILKYTDISVTVTHNSDLHDISLSKMQDGMRFLLMLSPPRTFLMADRGKGTLPLSRAKKFFELHLHSFQGGAAMTDLMLFLARKLRH